jgi:hypothetical protein
MSPNLEGRATPASVGLYWLPLGAGDAARCVRWNGRVFEALVARHEHRDPCDLYHSALARRGERPTAPSPRLLASSGYDTDGVDHPRMAGHPDGLRG